MNITGELVNGTPRLYVEEENQENFTSENPNI